jgi:hypothetical protein
MLNIRMSRTPIEGSPAPGCSSLTPGRAHILMWSRFVTGTTSACIPIGDTGPIGGFPAGQESAARAAVCSPSRPPSCLWVVQHPNNILDPVTETCSACNDDRRDNNHLRPCIDQIRKRSMTKTRHMRRKVEEEEHEKQGGGGEGKGERRGKEEEK